MANLKYRKFLSAFTLLELIFVILIIGIMSTTILALYQQYSQAAKTKTTAQQMELLLQAASSYFIDNNCWPNADNCATNVANFNQYLNFLDATKPINPWGNNYTWQADSNGKKFQVYSGNLPSAAIAQQLNALLATGKTFANNQVLAETVMPQKAASSAEYIITAIGATAEQANASTISFNVSCPPPQGDWQFNAAALPIMIAMPDGPDPNPGFTSSAGPIPGSETFSTLTAGSPSWTTTSAPNTQTATFTVTENGYGVGDSLTDSVLQNNGIMRFVYIGWCAYSPNSKSLAIK